MSGVGSYGGQLKVNSLGPLLRGPPVLIKKDESKLVGLICSSLHPLRYIDPLVTTESEKSSIQCSSETGSFHTKSDGIIHLVMIQTIQLYGL
jgi:hypothetical protein